MSTASATRKRSKASKIRQIRKTSNMAKISTPSSITSIAQAKQGKREKQGQQATLCKRGITQMAGTQDLAGVCKSMRGNIAQGAQDAAGESKIAQESSGTS
eukprot:11533681-Alexandrium_andersonii.AAC.1